MRGPSRLLSDRRLKIGALGVFGGERTLFFVENLVPLGEEGNVVECVAESGDGRGGKALLGELWPCDLAEGLPAVVERLGSAAGEEAGVLDGLPEAETAREGVFDASSDGVVHLEALEEGEVGARNRDLPLSSEVGDDVVLLAHDAALLDAVVHPLGLVDEVRRVQVSVGLDVERLGTDLELVDGASRVRDDDSPVGPDPVGEVFAVLAGRNVEEHGVGPDVWVFDHEQALHPVSHVSLLLFKFLLSTALSLLQ